MRTRLPWKLALLVGGLALAASCADSPLEPTHDGATGTVQVAVASLEYPELTGATFELTIEDSLGALIYYNPAISTDDYGTPDGRVLFIAPCSAGNGPTPGVGAPGSEVNTITVRLLEVRTDGEVLTAGGGDVVFPPAVSRDVLCVENQDVRADFLLTFVRRAQQGFVDAVVQIQGIFCSYKIDCVQLLMAAPEPPYAPGPTLVTGFTCTDGDDTGTNYVGFVGELCCNGAPLGDASCTTLAIDSETGEPVWSAPGVGVLDTRSYMDSEAILGKVFHNTTWRLDADAVAGGCVFYGMGHFNWNNDGTPVDFAYFPGADGVSPAPAFIFTTEIADANETGEMLCMNADVEIIFGPELPEIPGGPELPTDPTDEDETAFAFGGDDATCFLDLPGLTGNRWGWTNGPLSPSSTPYVFELHASAAQCDLEAGTLVGTLTVEYGEDGLTATFAVDAGLQISESHLYVGASPTPVGPNGNPTVAPGQYPYSNDAPGSTHTYTIEGLEGPVYVIGHASVGPIPE